MICATNVPVYERATANKFRQDLLYRINTVEIHLPPLRERKGDIPLLTEYFLSIYKRKYNKPELKIDPVTIRYFENYEWFGNIRELQNAIERSVILCDSHTLKLADISLLPNSSACSEESFNTMNLEEKEIEAWQKLIRVLTHEIMKSITPISSLASTAAGMIKNSGQEKISKEPLDDIENALTTIHRRSDGLTLFINKFSDLSKIPKQNFQTVSVLELF